jgi:hypothetical protein
MTKYSSSPLRCRGIPRRPIYLLGVVNRGGFPRSAILSYGCLVMSDLCHPTLRAVALV